MTLKELLEGVRHFQVLFILKPRGIWNRKVHLIVEHGVIHTVLPIYLAEFPG